MTIEVVANETIQRAVYALMINRDRFLGYDLTKESDRVELGNSLYDLNNRAVNARNGTRKRALKYAHSSLDPVPPIMQLYKSLHFLLTQCESEKTRFTYMFRELEAAKARLAVYLVENSQEYEACKWE